MSIRSKCALLVLAFEGVLCLTLLLTVRYIGAYFADAAEAMHASNTGLNELSRMRTLVRRELSLLARLDEDPSQREEIERISNEINHRRASVGALAPDTASRSRVIELFDRQRSSVAAYVAASRIARDGALPAFDPAAHLAIDTRLGALQTDVLAQSSARVDRAFAGQRGALMILWINAVAGIALGTAGLILVRRWVIQPIGELENTVDEFGRGNLEHRASVSTSGEFARLAETVNRMAADLSQIEKRMIQRERLAAMGELIGYVAHNIRNPLAGIQAAAEASSRQLPPDSDVHAHQEAIVAAIIRFQSWLRELEHMCDPLNLSPEDIELRTLLDNVVSVFRPMSQRRSIELHVSLPDPHQRVRVDPRHFEQAVAALLGNALEAAGDHGRVVIGSSSNGDLSHWLLFVEDSGPGIPADRVGRIFEPTYSTKKGGHGLGLTMVRKIVQMHGGDIQVASTPGAGSSFTLLIPNSLPERT